MNDKKVCSILTEETFSLEAGKLDYAIVGIGINVNFQKEVFPKEIYNTAAYIKIKKILKKI